MNHAPDSLPRRIAHVLGTAQPEGRAIQMLVENLARYIDKSRYTLAAWFLNDGPLAQKLREQGLEVRTVSWAGSAHDLPGALRFARLLRREQADILHMHVGGMSARALVRVFSRSRIVLHIHSLGLESDATGGSGHSGRFADRVAANSAASAACVRDAVPVVIHPGISLASPAGDVMAPDTGSDVGGGQWIVVGTVARLVPIKGIGTLIEAMASLSSSAHLIRLEIAGAGPELETLAQQAAAAGRSDRITFLGWRDDVRSVMRGWDIYCQPSLAEGFGLGVIEAMAEGLPVVCSDVGGMREIVANGETGWLVPPQDSRAVRDAILRLAGNEAERRRLGLAGRARVQRHFSAEREAAEIQSLYDSLVS